jgi:hypothetical protein
MEPNSGDVYTVQQQPGGVRLERRTSSRLRMEPQRMTVSPEELIQRRPTHVSEARQPMTLYGDLA